jgi:uncharacterized protein YjbI with pentapeptide repeats
VCDDSRVPDFIGRDLTGSRFDDVCLTFASFHEVDLSNARFRLVDMTGVVIRGAALKHMNITGWIDNLLVNGIGVAPLVQAEPDRRYPDRAKMRPAPSTWRMMTCPTSPACRVIGQRGRRSTRCSRCALTGWPLCAVCWPISPMTNLPG